jgi:hypothetical protein
VRTGIVPGRSTRSLGVILTIREHLRHRVIWTYVIGLVGVLILWVAAASGDEGIGNIASLIGLVGIAVGVLFLTFGLRCPKCKGNLAATAAPAAFPFWSKHRVNFCQFCGVSIDERLMERK